MRSAALSLLLLAAAAAPAAAAPTLSRSPTDAGQLVLQVPSAPGESREYSVSAGSGPLVFDWSPEQPAPAEPWTITASDCAQDAGTGDVTCSGPVTSLSLTTGDGDEHFGFSRTSFSLFASMGGGRDFIGGGALNDVIDAGAGTDSVQGDKGSDRIVGGPDDDDLFGGPGRDVIDGGLGIDRMFGEGGLDRLLARDGVADNRIDCGKGNDRKERAKVDSKDPSVRSC